MINSDGLASPDGFMDVETVETPGTIIDAAGKTWRVPEFNLDDEASDYAQDILDVIRQKFDSRFYYQTIPLKKLEQYELRGFRACTKEEFGLSNSHPLIEGEPGVSKEPYVIIDGAILVKCLRQQRDRDKALEEAAAREQLNLTRPNEEQREKMANRAVGKTKKGRQQMLDADRNARDQGFKIEEDVKNWRSLPPRQQRR